MLPEICLFLADQPLMGLNAFASGGSRWAVPVHTVRVRVTDNDPDERVVADTAMTQTIMGRAKVLRANTRPVADAEIGSAEDDPLF